VDSSDPLDSLPPVSLEVPSLALEEDFVEVVETEVVCAASFSAVVSLGGMMFGVLCGAGSDTLLPPQAPSVRPLSRRRAMAPAVTRGES
jgi:hypothetical protein